jgi:hypothetical protein
MKEKLPEHILEAMRDLIDQKLPAEQISFMMRVNLDVVKKEIAERNKKTTALADRAAQ